jgi:CheY-like chemotaxis protein
VPNSVLIVEDEWLIADDYATTLSDAGCLVVGPCASVRAALVAISQHSIQAALLDVELLEERSFPVAERLRELGIPFVFVTGHAARELPRALRGSEVLSKPVEPATLLAVVNRMTGAA